MKITVNIKYAGSVEGTINNNLSEIVKQILPVAANEENGPKTRSVDIEQVGWSLQVFLMPMLYGNVTRSYVILMYLTLESVRYICKEQLKLSCTSTSEQNILMNSLLQHIVDAELARLK